MSFLFPPVIPNKNCEEIYILHEDLHNKNGLYVVQPDDGGEFVVYCDMTQIGGGWTVIQRRVDSSLDFYQNWDLYRAGFGNFSANFWLGLEKIRRLTNSVETDQTMELYIGLETFDLGDESLITHRVYDSFRLETNDYKLYVHKCSTTDATVDIDDSLMFHNEQPFSTFDKDNDGGSGINCANDFRSGWWFKGHSCLHSNLNGIYYEKGVFSYAVRSGIVWTDFTLHESLKYTVMAIRPVDKCTN